MGFPFTRMRRLRRTASIRDMVRESSLDSHDLILPLFVRSGKNLRKNVSSMPGVYQLSVDTLVDECTQAYNDGVRSVILFGIPDHKDPAGSAAYDDYGIIPQSVRALKSAIPDLIVITDVCMCEYTDHGHCGVIKNGDVDNDATLELLAKESLVHARAGADMVAPSDMMDGRVKRIRQAMDEEGFENVAILSYATKYASGFYGPFRKAAESTPQFGNRRSYHMDPGNSREALREIALDIEEGADIIMVKPAMTYLDIVREARNHFNIPIAAYQVSGEYAMIHAAAQNGWIDLDSIVMECLLSIKRAGADMILTYFARKAARMLS